MVQRLLIGEAILTRALLPLLVVVLLLLASHHATASSYYDASGTDQYSSSPASPSSTSSSSSYPLNPVAADASSSFSSSSSSSSSSASTSISTPSTIAPTHEEVPEEGGNDVPRVASNFMLAARQKKNYSNLTVASTGGEEDSPTRAVSLKELLKMWGLDDDDSIVTTTRRPRRGDIEVIDVHEQLASKARPRGDVPDDVVLAAAKFIGVRPRNKRQSIVYRHADYEEAHRPAPASHHPRRHHYQSEVDDDRDDDAEVDDVQAKRLLQKQLWESEQRRRQNWDRERQRLISDTRRVQAGLTVRPYTTRPDYDDHDVLATTQEPPTTTPDLYAERMKAWYKAKAEHDRKVQEREMMRNQQRPHHHHHYNQQPPQQPWQTEQQPEQRQEQQQEQRPEQPQQQEEEQQLQQHQRPFEQVDPGIKRGERPYYEETTTETPTTTEDPRSKNRPTTFPTSTKPYDPENERKLKEYMDKITPIYVDSRTPQPGRRRNDNPAEDEERVRQENLKRRQQQQELYDRRNRQRQEELRRQQEEERRRLEDQMRRQQEQEGQSAPGLQQRPPISPEVKNDRVEPQEDSNNVRKRPNDYAEERRRLEEQIRRQQQGQDPRNPGLKRRPPTSPEVKNDNVEPQQQPQEDSNNVRKRPDEYAEERRRLEEQIRRQQQGQDPRNPGLKRRPPISPEAKNDRVEPPRQPEEDSNNVQKRPNEYRRRPVEQRVEQESVKGPRTQDDRRRPEGDRRRPPPQENRRPPEDGNDENRRRPEEVPVTRPPETGPSSKNERVWIQTNAERIAENERLRQLELMKRQQGDDRRKQAEDQSRRLAEEQRRRQQQMEREPGHHHPAHPHHPHHQQHQQQPHPQQEQQQPQSTEDPRSYYEEFRRNEAAAPYNHPRAGDGDPRTTATTTTTQRPRRIQVDSRLREEIDFPGLSPDRRGPEASRFPAPVTRAPPVKSPSACVWAVVACCQQFNPEPPRPTTTGTSQNTTTGQRDKQRRLNNCFEAVGCPELNWEPDRKCRADTLHSANQELRRFYLGDKAALNVRRPQANFEA